MMNKHRVTILIFMLLFAISQLCYAADNTVTIIAEGIYIMGDGETAAAAEQRAFENAKRSAIEQAGVYVESYSQTKNVQLSKDEVNIISSGLVRATVIDKKRTIEGENGFRFWCKVNCIIKLDSIADMKARLSDKQLIDQYKDLQAKSAKIEQDLVDLKAQLQNSTSEAVKKATETKIAQNEQKANIQDMLEQAYQMNFYNREKPKTTLLLEMSPGNHYRAELTHMPDTYKSVLKLYWQDTSQSWKEVYEDVIAMGMPRLEKTRMIPDRDSLVVYSVEGSGSFVTLKVLSYINNQFKYIVAPETIGQSNVKVGSNFVVIEGYSGNQTLFYWENGLTKSYQTRKKEAEVNFSDVVFKYNILSSGEIELPSNEITMKIGDVLHIVVGNNKASLAGIRMLSDQASGEILQTQQGSITTHLVLKAINTGTAIMTIIPNGGYDWEHARKITINIAN